MVYYIITCYYVTAVAVELRWPKATASFWFWFTRFYVCFISVLLRALMYLCR
jgi:hypothetical protein